MSIFEIENIINKILLPQEKELIESEFMCQICKKLIFNRYVYQCRIGDWYCDSCVKSKVLKKKRCSIYELNNALIDENKDISEEDENRCSQKITISELNGHIETCQFRFVKCKNQGCEMELRFKDLQVHSDKCGYEVIMCQLCNHEVIRSKLEHH
ncbi:hypothetical protein DICPUDRAFT_42674, partial [Dictyostelium purpureum]